MRPSVLKNSTHLGAVFFAGKIKRKNTVSGAAKDFLKMHMTKVDFFRKCGRMG